MANLTNNTSIYSRDAEIPKGLGYGLLTVILVFINCMVIVAFKRRVKKKRGIPDVFVLNLAISAILTGVIVLPIVAYASVTGNHQFVGLKFYCYLQCYVGTTLRLLDVAITTGIAIDRFVALWKPIYYRTKVKLKHGCIASLFIWFFILSIGILPFLIEDGISIQTENLCTADWTKWPAYLVLFVAYVQFIIVLICYVGIYRCINAFISRQKAMTESQTITYNSNSELPKSNSCQSLPDCVKEEKNRSNSAVSFCTSSASSGDDESEDSNSSHVNQSFEAEITDKLCELSKDNFKLALGKMKDASNIEVETRIKLTTKQRSEAVPPNLLSAMRTPKTTSSSVDLRIKAAINRVSWSTLPQIEKLQTKKQTIMRKSESEENIAKYNLDKNKKLESQDTVIVINQPSKSLRQETCRRQTCPNTMTLSKTNDNDEVFLPESSLKPKEKRAVSLGGEKVLRSLSILINGKLKVKKLRRQSSNLKSFWKESERFAKIMGVVVLIFYISWLPLAIAINITLVSSKSNEAAGDFLRMCYNLSLLSNFAIPIAYAVMCKPYRVGYKLLCKCVKKPFQPNDDEYDVNNDSVF